MNAERYAEFLARCGTRVRHAAGAAWTETSRGVWMSFPYQLELDPAAVAKDPPLRAGDIAARWPCALAEGRASYRLVCRGADYGFARLESKSRNQTRRGLERCTVAREDPAALLADAEELERDTRERQGRRDGDPGMWKRLLAAAAATEGAEAWAARIDGRVGAFLLAFRMDGWLHVTHVRSRRAMLGMYPNNALLYEVNRRSLAEGGCQAVSIGFESIQAEVDGLDHFKIALGYVREPVGCRILLAPLGRALALAIRAPGGRALVARAAGAEGASKLEGMVRWVREQDAVSGR